MAHCPYSNCTNHHRETICFPISRRFWSFLREALEQHYQTDRILKVSLNFSLFMQCIYISLLNSIVFHTPLILHPARHLLPRVCPQRSVIVEICSKLCIPTRLHFMGAHSLLSPLYFEEKEELGAFLMSHSTLV